MRVVEDMAWEVCRTVGELPESACSKLYENQWACVSMMRLMPPLGRQLLMRLVHLGQERVELLRWVDEGEVQRQRLEEVVRKMEEVKILYLDEDVKESDGVSVRINPTFSERILQFLLQRDTSPWSKGRIMGDSPDTTAEELQQWAQNRWESILHYMVSPGLDPMKRPEPGWKPTKWVRGILVGEDKNGNSFMMSLQNLAPKITAFGFQFLLRPLRNQILQMLMHVLTKKGSENKDLQDSLSCIFQLSFCTLGAGYRLDLLSRSNQELITSLHDLGAVYFKPNDRQYFFPTPLIVNLCTESEVPSGPSTDAGVADEFSAEPAAGILRLFTRPIYKFPHMIIAVITRESIRNALIIEYLRMHAHPQCLENWPIVPEVVTDQICFWEQERCRIRAEPAVAYHNFFSGEAHRACEKEARRLKFNDKGPGEVAKREACLYSDTSEQLLVVPEAADPLIRKFIETSINE
ncbi:TFB2 transcription factor B2 nucleotide excision repair [Guillardia theta CCMP2712]|uniref:General transcription factor IIH subunit 4 n=1 Tax=Guillardia theta (strain CCMP2712) TaxID=905079 RepID=L1JP30_GUITC|nr:TFB2 transcription factor B2 nucleotide excision repair [Guillardia theta CCMP2712]EKX50217.1 TFB2 transcription factor B2 nucleotide excision repair [Guillardia theta CCMP2712]|eukprot:XP_005837197.1 TFB2 transcription factor B2 nucleotide excision repair [Guillardia theta CCMP2712]